MDYLYDTVIAPSFSLPFQPYTFQKRIAEEVTRAKKGLVKLKVGRGKTVAATITALLHTELNNANSIFAIVPAPLIRQWSKWFKSIRIKSTDQTLKVLEYTGTNAKKRAELNLAEYDCVVMSHNIFRIDFTRLFTEFGQSKQVVVIYDEAQDGLRKRSNRIWKYFRQFTMNKPSVLLTGTPVSGPEDQYGLLGLLDQYAYTTRRQFENEHVAERDFWGQITEWKNLDILRDKFESVCFDVLNGEVQETPPAVVTRIPYQLNSKHKAAYIKFINEGWLTSDDGEAVLNAVKWQNMFHAAQQFITAPDRLLCSSFDSDELIKMVKTVYDEDDSKIIIYANYRNTNNKLLAGLKTEYGEATVVGVWGEHTQNQQQQSIESFKTNPNTRILVGNPKSLGVGTDGLQHVCFRTLFVELPLTPPQFEQAVGRIDREGQTIRPCSVSCLVAEGTIQETLLDSFMKKDDLLQMIVSGRCGMRKIFGLE